MVAVPLALVAALYWLHVKMRCNLRSNGESKYQDNRVPNLRTPSSCRGCELLQLQEDNEDIYRLTNRFYLEQLCHDWSSYILHDTSRPDLLWLASCGVHRSTCVSILRHDWLSPWKSSCNLDHLDAHWSVKVLSFCVPALWQSVHHVLVAVQPWNRFLRSCRIQAMIWRPFYRSAWNHPVALFTCTLSSCTHLPNSQVPLAFLKVSRRRSFPLSRLCGVLWLDPVQRATDRRT